MEKIVCLRVHTGLIFFEMFNIPAIAYFTRKARKDKISRPSRPELHILVSSDLRGGGKGHGRLGISES
jgi:hypothetical protein